MTLGRDKIRFLHTPTPLHRLDRISADLGVEFYMKRDDLTDFGTGGNKLRKLEYFLKDALDQNATMILTVGGAQTNHGRLTAAVCAKYGLKSAIVAVDPYPGEISANLLLDGIMDCHVYLVQKLDGQDEGQLLQEAVDRVTKEWEDRGERVYYIPMGGSNELGALGYYDCALELAEQVREMGLAGDATGPNGTDPGAAGPNGMDPGAAGPNGTDPDAACPRVLTTVGSMGTYIGLATALANEDLPMRLTRIGVLPYRDIRRSVAKYYVRVQAAYGLKKEMGPEDFDVTSDYDYGAYNNPVKDVREAIYYMGRMEGIILDPCYTGKTFNAYLRMLREGKIAQGETVIMLHTGGLPGIYTAHHRVEMEKELMEHRHIL